MFNRSLVCDLPTRFKAHLITRVEEAASLVYSPSPLHPSIHNSNVSFLYVLSSHLLVRCCTMWRIGGRMMRSIEPGSRRTEKLAAIERRGVTHYTILI